MLTVSGMMCNRYNAFMSSSRRCTRVRLVSAGSVIVPSCGDAPSLAARWTSVNDNGGVLRSPEQLVLNQRCR